MTTVRPRLPGLPRGLPALPGALPLPGPLAAAAGQAENALTLVQAGLARPIRPSRLLAGIRALRRYGLSVGTAYAVAALRYPDQAAIVDEAGSLSFAEVDARTSAMAAGLEALGVGGGDRVALLCRNHRGFVEGLAALAKLGADALLLNTSFAGPQLAATLRSERASAVIHDDEFTDLLRGAGVAAGGPRRVLAWTDAPLPPRSRTATLERLARRHEGAAPLAPGREGRIVVLTSGTTGSPKGAARANPASVEPAAALLSRIPLRSRDTVLIAAPLFHSWGLAHLLFGSLLSSTLVLQRRFDPEATLAAATRHRADVLVAVPVMLQRILDLPAARRRAAGRPPLRVVAVSGSALPGPLATRFMDEYGDVLYNLYGSTEVAWATIATPEDLRAAPGTAGRPPRGTVVRILDGDARVLPPGESGRIFVGNSMVFQGYTGGGDKHRVDGLVSTGDVGRFDAEGRLLVEGRDDDMIVSGGENVFPGEVEDLLAHHPAIAEAAVAGVADAEFGQRLAAYVVVRAGATLDADAVRAHVRANLARYKVPRDVVFVGELPRNATGKVLRRQLPAAAAAPPPPAADSPRPRRRPRR